VVYECAGGAVVAQDRRLEAADTGARRTHRERAHQRRADASALPAIDHLDGHLGRVELLKAHIAGDPDRRPGRR
jgi:hypothetical protein